ncbi:amidase [Zhihengliuella salsuginis]|uniref:Amidase n=1 Tax=Zhihengliuella salsuginis TaxID=578222 RepID=A0ABQ3GMQ8_9MICC|nr:amidase family protein [Zhihengliuella salsuginis]GHD13056.1 amidase [Zhihengliuella salsuginis]
MTDLHEKSATELTGLLAAGELSSRELTRAHLDRIDAVNAGLNAIVTLDAEGAMERATAADRRFAESGPAGLLHGLPMTHKDTHQVARMRSTNGSPAFADHVPERDDLIIARLRAAGVVATGKSNVPEFGAGSHTFNEVFGTTVNPYDRTRSAGGSSGGLAAALAARIQPLGEGSDMGGSVRIPASFCNVFGFRPSLGVIPMPSERNAWAWLGRVGPMARTVQDLELFMRATSGPAPELQLQAPLEASAFGGEAPADLRGVRIGVSRDFGLGVPVETPMLAALDRAVAVFVSLGATVEEATIDLSEADRVFGDTRAMDFASGLGGLVDSKRELVKPEVVWNVEKGWALSARDLLETTAAATRLQERVRAYFQTFDLFLTPGAQVLPFDASIRYPEQVAGVESQTYLDWMRSACLVSATGLPTVAMPAGFSESGLPTGVQLSAFHYRDPQLLRVARVFEAATDYARVARDVSGDGGGVETTTAFAGAHHHGDVE